MLSLEQVTVGYVPGTPVLHDVDIEVSEGEMVALIGSNGAGKSTTLRTIMGILHPWKGRVLFDGRDVSRMETPDLVRAGIAIVPEGRRLFPTLSVRENLLVGAYTRWGRDVQARLDSVYEMFPHLRALSGRQGGALSGGEQQMVAIGRALMTSPRMLLLDEPSMGLAPVIVEGIFEGFGTLSKQGVTIMVVEQNAFVALESAARGYVIEQGRVVMSGPSAELAADKGIQRAYMGV